jgi:ABC-type uncharacterized transport system auxiliary subunit
MMELARWVFVTLLALCMGCALLGKGKPLARRYFDLQSDDGYRPAPQANGARLKLGEVRAARHIDRRFASRESAHELSYHDAWRFSDQPEAFLERALSRNLFERAAITRVVSGAGSTLEVELTAFEQSPDDEKVQVTALARLHDDRVQLWQRTFAAEQKVEAGDEAEVLAAALSQALAQVAAQITEQTLQALARAEPPPAASAPQPGPAALAQPVP